MYEHRVGNLTGLVHNDNHKWFVINQMSPDQVWIFCQFDNKTKICVPHSSVDVVGAKSNARPRKSIESRCLIRYKIWIPFLGNSIIIYHPYSFYSWNKKLPSSTLTWNHALILYCKDTYAIQAFLDLRC